MKNPLPLRLPFLVMTTLGKIDLLWMSRGKAAAPSDERGSPNEPSEINTGAIQPVI